MKVEDLESGSWYRLISWKGRTEYCKYATRKRAFYYGYTFLFMDGDWYSYLAKDIREFMSLISRSFSKYLDLFATDSETAFR